MAKSDEQHSGEAGLPLGRNSLRVKWNGYFPEVSASGWGILGAVVIVLTPLILAAAGLSHIHIR
jgi:hypothetical protein